MYHVKAVVAPGRRGGGGKGAVGVDAHQLDSVVRVNVASGAGSLVRGRDCVPLAAHCKGVNCHDMGDLVKAAGAVDGIVDGIQGAAGADPDQLDRAALRRRRNGVPCAVHLKGVDVRCAAERKVSRAVDGRAGGG